VLVLTAALFIGFASVPLIYAQSFHGPRISELTFYYYADETSLYSALKAGTNEMSLWPLTSAQYRDAITDPNIILCPISNLDMVAFSLNNNETIPTYPGVVSVTSDVNFRKALWCMVDRDYYTEVICGGFATPVYVPVAAPQRAWVDTATENYVRTVYAYNIQAASNNLDAGGFTQRTGDTNPYYNPAVQGSAQYWRGYPVGWPKAGQRIDPVVLVARVDDGLRYAASIHLRDRMLVSGIPVNFISVPSSSALIRVMLARDYQIYSASWSVGRFATYQYSWLHTSRWMPGGSNYHVSPTSPGYSPAIPPKRPEDTWDLDCDVSNVMYPPSLAIAIANSKIAQSTMCKTYATFIPLWSSKAFYAYRNLFGVMNMEGYGQENIYTFLNAWRAGGGSTMRVGLKSPPSQVNQVYSSWPWDVATMSPTMDDFMSIEPYNLLDDQPWLAQDWTSAPGMPSGAPGTWVDPDDGMTKSMMRYWFRDDLSDRLGDDDAEWINPGTPVQGGGSILADFTPQWLGGGYEFNSWYYDTEPSGWMYTGYKDIKHIVCNLAGKYADVYFDTSSYWSQYWGYGRLLYSIQPSSVDQIVLGWKSNPLSTQQTRSFGPMPANTFLHAQMPTGGGASIPIRGAGTPVEVISMTIDGVPATKATTPHLYDPATGLGAGGDYSIVGSSANGPSLRIFKQVNTGLTVTYWARGQCAGYWPGGTNFQTTLIGTGPFYMTDFLAGAGGWARYKANQHYFMETPQLGEIDWDYVWIAGPQPRDGSYTVTLFDVTYACFALGSSGNYIPTYSWVPSVDVVHPLGTVDISDIGVIANSFMASFGSPPPTPP
jgi:hypothetical protein